VNNLSTSADQSSSGSSAPDFIDFYQLLGADVEATTTALRRKINDLYQEAQSNRDHRNPTKRRRYEALCDLLPYCRIVLLDPDKRARYDRYREHPEAGKAVPPLDAMMDEIAGRVDDSLSGANGEKIGLLAVKGDDDYLPVAPHLAVEEPGAGAGGRKGLFNKPSARPSATASSPVAATTQASQPVATTSSTRSAVAQNEETYAPTPSASATGGLTPVGFGVIVFALVALTMKVFNATWEMALLVGVVTGIIALAVGNALSSGSKKSRRNRVQ
jgi:hypothetical protein